MTFPGGDKGEVEFLQALLRSNEIHTEGMQTRLTEAERLLHEIRQGFSTGVAREIDEYFAKNRAVG